MDLVLMQGNGRMSLLTSKCEFRSVAELRDEDVLYQTNYRYSGRSVQRFWEV